MSFPEDTTVNINWDLVPIITCCDLPIIGTERRHVRVQSVELILDFETKYDSHLNERSENEKLSVQLVVIFITSLSFRILK